MLFFLVLSSIIKELSKLEIHSVIRREVIFTFHMYYKVFYIAFPCFFWNQLKMEKFSISKYL